MTELMATLPQLKKYFSFVKIENCQYCSNWEYDVLVLYND